MELVIIRGLGKMFGGEIQVWETTADNLLVGDCGVYLEDTQLGGCRYLGEFYAQPFRAIFGWMPEEGTAYRCDVECSQVEELELD